MLLLVLIGLTACASNQIILHPITNKDIIFVPAGSSVRNVIIDRDGYFLSKDYMGEVIKVKVEGK